MKFVFSRGGILLPLLLALLFLTSTVPALSTQEIKFENAKKITPQAEVVLSIDDGRADDGVGPSSRNPGFGWFNMLKPDGYPATLKEVQIAFNNSANGIRSGTPIRVVVYLDPEENGPNNGQRPDAIFPVTVNSPGTFERYTLPQPISINNGAFAVGALDTIFVADVPALIDLPGTVAPAGARSYFTLDNGQTFGNVAQVFPQFGVRPGSWLVRALVDVQNLSPVISRVFYRKEKLRIIARNLDKDAIVRINDARVRVPIKFDQENSRLIIKGSRSDLNLKPAGQSNRLIVIVDGNASAVFEFTT